MYYAYNLFDELKDFFNDFYGNYQDSRADYPYINMYENDDKVSIRAVLPGVKSEDISIELVDRSLTIKGDRKLDYVEKPYIRRERSFGVFNKSIRLPYQVDREKIAANLSDGILTVELVKSEEARPRKIEIK